MNKVLYIDMDGVMADFETAVRSMEKNMIWDDVNVNRVCKNNPHIFEFLPEISDAISSIYVLKDKFDIYFLSTPMCNIPESYMGKRRWLMNKFGKWSDKRLILTHRKDLCIGDYLIDDRPTKNGAGKFKGEFIHFGSDSFQDWQAILKYLL